MNSRIINTDISSHLSGGLSAKHAIRGRGAKLLTSVEVVSEFYNRQWFRAPVRYLSPGLVQFLGCCVISGIGFLLCLFAVFGLSKRQT